MLNKFRRFLKAREDSFSVLNLQKEKTRPLAIAGFDLHDQTQLRSNWKLVAKLATGFMSVRIPMLSVFELHELYQCQKF